MTGFLWYLLGLLVSWVILKIVRLIEKDDTVEGFVHAIIVSLFSWAGICMIVIYAIVEFLEKKLPIWKEIKGKKISKWL